MTCNVTGTARRPDGTAYASALLEFVPLPAVTRVIDGDVILPTAVQVMTGADGAVNFNLLPGTYQVKDQDGPRFAFIAPDAAAVDFADGVDAPAIEVYPDAVATVLAARTDTLIAAGAGYGAAPTSAAIITSAQTAKREGVPLLSILGGTSSASGYYDLTTDISSKLYDIFAAGLMVTDDAATKIVTHSTLQLCDGFRWRGNTKLLRGWASSGVSTPVLGQAALTTAISNVEIDGLTIGLLAEDMSCTGAGLNLNLSNGKLRNIDLRTQNNNGGAGHGFLMRGTDIEINGCRHTIAAGTGSGSMSFKVIGGERIRVLNCSAFPNDDAFGVVVNASPNSDIPNLGAKNVIFANCFGVTQAKLAVIGASSNPSGQHNTYTGVIEGITFLNIAGSGQYAAIQMDIDDVASGYMAVDNVLFQNVGTAGTPAGTQSAINITGQHIGTIGRVTIRDGRRKDPVRKRGIRVNAPGIDLTLDRVHAIGIYNGLHIKRAQGNITLRGGCVIETVPGTPGTDSDDEVAENNMQSALLAAPWKAYSWSTATVPTGRLRLDLGTDTRIIGVATPSILGVPTPMPAIDLEADNVDLIWLAGQALPYSGATGNNLIQSSSSANTALLGNITSTLTGAETSGPLTITRTTTATIADNSLALTKLATIANTRMLGNASGAAGNVTALTASQVKANLAIAASDIVAESSTVAGLPSAATAGAGARRFVTNANATTFASIVAGGGSNAVPVYSDGTNWRIG